MVRACAGVLLFLMACDWPSTPRKGETPTETTWHPVQQRPSPTQRGDVVVDAISPAHPVPGHRLLVRGTGFGQDASHVLVRLAAGNGLQRRAVWLHPASVSPDLLELTVPAQLTGTGTILVETQQGRSNIGALQFQDGRPYVAHVRLLPVETIVAVTGELAGVTAADLVVDGRNMGAVRELGTGVYSGPGFLQWAGPHDLVVRFSNGTESPPFHIDNR